MAVYGMMFTVSLLVVVTTSTVEAHLHNIYIDPATAEDSFECHTSNSSRIPCKSLEYAFEYRMDSTNYILQPNTFYTLRKPVDPFKHLKFLALSGSESVISCDGEETGLAFVNVSNLEIVGVTFEYCAATRHSTSRKVTRRSTSRRVTNSVHSEVLLYEFKVGLYFYLCANVHMKHVNVSLSPNATGVVMYDTGGNNTIENSVFMDNKVTPPNSYGGGGFYVEFSYCIPGEKYCSNKFNTHPVVGAYYFFMNSTFSNNVASNEASEERPETISSVRIQTYIVPDRSNHQAFGRGGGLSVFVKGGAINNVFHISNCRFTNNKAQWGGGLFLEFHDNATDNSAYITDCILSDNECSYTLETGTGGGGMRIGHYVYKNISNSKHGNYIEIIHSKFLFNSAMYGGGLSVSPALQYTDIGKEAFLKLENVTFQSNFAKLGGALHISAFPLVTKGIMMNVVVSSCSFKGNSVSYADLLDKRDFPHTLGIGAVYIHQVLNVAFKGEIYFRDNSGTALALTGSAVNFAQSIVNFTDNSGYRGGAISLLGASYILIDQDTKIFFDNNTATDKGGAIYNKYIEMDDSRTQPNCFIRHVDPSFTPEEWTATFQFHNNLDQNRQRGNSIHSSSLRPCSWAGGNGYEGIQSVFCWDDDYWIYYDDILQVNCSKQITTEPSYIRLRSDNIQVFPGQVFMLPISIKNDYNIDVTNSTILSYTYGGKQAYAMEGKVSLNRSDKVDLLINAPGDNILVATFRADRVKFIPCPPGFKETGGVCKCCSYNGSVKCDRDTLKRLAVEAKLAANHWIGSLNDSDKYFVGKCPSSFCGKTQSDITLPKKSADLNDVVCNNNRTGVICGECTSGLGPAVNSEIYECVECTNSNLYASIAKYLISTYYPSIFLFSALISFDLHLTNGPAHAFILYCQMVSSSFHLETSAKITTNYKTIYGLFNLEFLENLLPPFCLSPTFDILTVMLLDYGLALSPLIVIVIVFGLKKCLFLRENILEHAFPTFILLSYTKFSLTLSRIVKTQPLMDEDDATVYPSRVYYAGQYESTDPNYFYYYQLPSAFIFTVFVLAPPVFLLVLPLKIFEQCLCRISFLWALYPVERINMLLDAFQGCYKENMRFFAGLYFLFRLFFIAADCFMSDLVSRLLMQLKLCMLMIALVIVFQPYNAKNNLLNYTDALIFANLALVNSWHHYNKPLPFSDSIIEYALYLPLLYMVVHVAWNIYISYFKEHSIYQLQKVGITGDLFNPPVNSFRRGKPSTLPSMLLEFIAPLYTEQDRDSGDLKGVVVIKEVSIDVINGYSKQFDWKGYGLRLKVPASALPKGIDICRIIIKASVSGQYTFPENTTLVSPVFWIKSVPICKFQEPVTLEIQHCAMPENSSRLFMVRASCAQKGLPYSFKIMNTGSFSKHSSYGVIDLNHFSGVGNVQQGSDQRLYWSGVFHMGPPTSREIHFAVTWCDDTHITIVRDYYDSKGAWRSTDQTLYFKGDEIALDVPLDGYDSKDGWRVFLLKDSVISKKDVDETHLGKETVIHSELKAIWKKKGRVKKPLEYRVKIDGTTKKRFFFTIYIEDDMPTDFSGLRRIDSYEPPSPPYEHKLEMKDLHDISQCLKFVRRRDIIKVGLALGLHLPNLDNMKQLPEDMVHAWLQRMDNVDKDPTVEGLIQALEESGLAGTAKTVRSKLLGQNC